MMTSSHWNTDYAEVVTFLVRKGTGSLSTPMMITAPITINPEKACCGIPTQVHPYLPGLKLNQYMYTTWLATQPVHYLGS